METLYRITEVLSGQFGGWKVLSYPMAEKIKLFCLMFIK